MLNTILITVAIIAVAVVLLGVRIFFVKGGRFPDTHISRNKAMQQRGITCAVSTDARDRNHQSLDDILSQKSN